MGNGKNMRIIEWIMKVPTIELKPLLSRVKAVKRTTLMLIIALVALPGVLLSLGFVHLVGTQKLYCLNCHVNQRDAEFWQKSAVHPDINCATCHDEQEGGPIYSSLHFAFSADEDLVNGKCVGCHKDDLDKPVGIDAEGKKAGPENELVRIPHAMHINELGIKCTFCHYNVFHERRSAPFATYRPRMETCYSCHDQSLASCDTCHPAGLPEEVSMDDSGGGRIIYRPEGYGPVMFDHAIHLSNDLTCGTCHDELFSMSGEKGGHQTMADMFAGKGCGSCHNGKGAFSSMECKYCHVGGATGGNLAYKNTGFGNVLFSHENHLAMGLECENCHTGLFGFRKTSGKMTMDMINKGKYCGGCHNGNTAFSADDCSSCHAMG